MDISWISKEIIGDLRGSWFDKFRLDINWITEEIFIGDLLDIKGDKKKSFGDLYWIFDWMFDWQTKEICIGYNEDV